MGVDIHEQIHITKEKLRKTTMVKDILTECNVSRYLYPSCYNDKMEMTRYFSFQFINAKEVQENTNWAIKSEGIQADGIVYTQYFLVVKRNWNSIYFINSIFL